MTPAILAQSASSWGDLLKEHGWPGVFVILVVVAIVRSARFFAPLITGFFAKHFTLMDRLEASLEHVNGVMDALRDGQRKHNAVQDAQLASWQKAMTQQELQLDMLRRHTENFEARYANAAKFATDGTNAGLMHMAAAQRKIARGLPTPINIDTETEEALRAFSANQGD